MAKIDESYTEDQIREFASQDILIGARFPNSRSLSTNLNYDDRVRNGYQAGVSISEFSGNYGDFRYRNPKTLTRIRHDNKRVIGLIRGENDDGSLQISLLGDNIRLQPTSGDTSPIRELYSNTYLNARADYRDVAGNKLFDFKSVINWIQSDDITSNTTNALQYINDRFSNGQTQGSYIYKEFWNVFFQFFCTQGYYYGQGTSTAIGDTTEIHLTNDADTTLFIGFNTYPGLDEWAIHNEFNDMLFDKYVYNNIRGNIYELLSNKNINIVGAIDAQSPQSPGSNAFYPWLNVMTATGTYCGQYEIYNVILTRSKTAAEKYIDDGTIPDDAIIHPQDPTNLPETEGDPEYDPSGGGDDDTDTPGEEGDNDRDTQPTPLVNPDVSPLSLTSNNLYWIQAGELASFIDWFWEDVGQITDINDLLDKIKGLYADLASTILNVRYMPIDPSWAGSTMSAVGINVGMITCPGNYTKFLNDSPIIRNIGSITINEKYKSFCDYSPYSNLLLYLPFHGMVELDNDFFMGQTLSVKTIYDIMSGTIQYFIFCGDVMTNSFIAQMAVDIPITLQSKADRDSAIFSNVANATANAIGAGLSAAAGNPIGLVMSTASATQGGQSSAPYKLLATQGESGAFYAPQKCAIYIRRPSYNRPKNYGARVGYPCNKQYTLESLKGFTTCYNPYIEFTHATKPLQSEIDEIYSLLERGVIL